MKKKSSYCASGTCVEVESTPESNLILVYDSLGNHCIYTTDEWSAFIKGVKDGEFDLNG